MTGLPLRINTLRREKERLRLVWILFFLVSFSLPSSSQIPRSEEIAQYQQLVNQYCVACHNEQLANAGLIIPEISHESVVREAKLGSE